MLKMCLLLFLMISFSQVYSQETDAVTLNALKKDFNVLTKRLKTDIPRLGTQVNKRDVFIFSTVTAGLFFLDGKISKCVGANYNPEFGLFANRVIQPLGIAGNIGIYSLFYGTGVFFGNKKAKETGLLLIETGIIGGTTVAAMKVITGRARPEKKLGAYHFFDPINGGISFPSGHTMAAFSTATVISQRYKNCWIRALSYGLAGLVGTERIYNNQHWSSDVFVGALIGHFVGKAVVELNKNENAKKKITLSPYGSTGLCLSIDF